MGIDHDAPSPTSCRVAPYGPGKRTAHFTSNRLNQSRRVQPALKRSQTGTTNDRAVSNTLGKVKKPLRIAALCIVLLTSLSASLWIWWWAKSNVDWYAPVRGATLTISGIADSEMRLYRASYAPFALLPDRRMVLVRSRRGQKQTYVILAPGPGHLPEGFRGSIRRCESAFKATPLFGFAYDLAPCLAPANNLDERREPQFGAAFVEFTDDSGKRARLEW